MAHHWFRALVLLALPLLAACAGEERPATPPPAAAAVTAGPALATPRPGPDAVTRFDGWYQGVQRPVNAGYPCRSETRSVWFKVNAGLIEMRNRRHRRKAVWDPVLAGTIAPDGQVALRATSSSRFVAGRIAGDGLVAQDVGEAVTGRDGRAACLFRYEAQRAAQAPDEQD